MENIRKNRDLLLSKIKMVHKSSFYSISKIPKLVAVSKKQDDYKIDEAIKCGHKFFGENRVQEAFLRWYERIKIYEDIWKYIKNYIQIHKNT